MEQLLKSCGFYLRFLLRIPDTIKVQAGSRCLCHELLVMRSYSQVEIIRIQRVFERRVRRPCAFMNMQRVLEQDGRKRQWSHMGLTCESLSANSMIFEIRAAWTSSSPSFRSDGCLFCYIFALPWARAMDRQRPGLRPGLCVFLAKFFFSAYFTSIITMCQTPSPLSLIY